MSTSIGFRPHNPKSLTYVDGGSSFLSVLERAFGVVPVVLDDNHIMILRGIEAAGYSGSGELIEAISNHGRIEIDSN